MKLKVKKLVSSQALNKSVIECPECKARYLVLSEKIREKSLNIRCGDCDHTFALSSSIVNADSNDYSSLSLLNDLSIEENFSSEGNEIAMDTISLAKNFEENKDKKNGEDAADAEETKEKEKADRYLKDDISKTALEDYLEAVSLDSWKGEDESQSDIDSIPLEQKNKIFLRAYSKQAEADEKSVDADENDSPPKEAPLDKGAEADTPQEEPIQEKQSIAPVDKGSDKRPLLLILIALILGALVVGGLLFFRNRPDNAVFPSRNSTSGHSGLVILEPLKGRYETNKNGGKIFVIEGKIANYYPKKIKVSYLQIEGNLYNKHNREIGNSNVYAGNVMSEAELRKRTKIEIMAFLNNKSGKNKSNLDVRHKQAIPFQVVFFKAPNNVYKIGAKISNFLKK